jgi:hypothetical protein
MKNAGGCSGVFFTLSFFIFFGITPTSAQDLDPRAYIRVPIKTTTFIAGGGYSYGGVLVDPSIPVKNVKADVQAASFGVARSFSLAGLSAQAMAVLPYTWAQASGDVNEQAQKVTRAGFADARLRLSVLFLGAPALPVEEFTKAPKTKTILGASINIVAPTGQFFSDKLINLGTNRWAFRPELALSQPVGKKWLLDVYTGVWLFTDNNRFYPGQSERSQQPMGTIQSHISYNFKPNLWVAYDITYYMGGASSVDGVTKDDRQSNFRAGFTAVFPTGKFSSLKFAVSKGAIVRIGQDFTSFSLGWQRSWFTFKKPPVSK